MPNYVLIFFVYVYLIESFAMVNNILNDEMKFREEKNVYIEQMIDFDCIRFFYNIMREEVRDQHKKTTVRIFLILI